MLKVLSLIALVRIKVPLYTPRHFFNLLPLDADRAGCVDKVFSSLKALQKIRTVSLRHTVFEQEMNSTRVNNV